jgi:hypothetical protein
MYLLVRRKLLECFLIEPIRILNGQINFVGDGGGGKMGGWVRITQSDAHFAVYWNGTRRSNGHSVSMECL